MRIHLDIYPSDIPQFCFGKYLKDNKHNSLDLARKYGRIFVRGHHLFLKAHSFSHYALGKLLGTDNVPGQISMHIFVGYCIYIQRALEE